MDWWIIILLAAIAAIGFYFLVRLGILEARDAIAGTALIAAIASLWQRIKDAPAEDDPEEDEEPDPLPPPATASDDAHHDLEDKIDAIPDQTASQLEQDLKDIADR